MTEEELIKPSRLVRAAQLMHRSMVGILILISAAALCSEAGIWNPFIALAPPSQKVKPQGPWPATSSSVFVISRDNSLLLGDCLLSFQMPSVSLLQRRELDRPAKSENNFKVNWLAHSARYSERQFSYENGAISNAAFFIATIPYWSIAVFTALYPLVFGYRFLRQRRKAQVILNACQTCRYNLTGNESGVCPECGELVEAAE